MLCHAFPQAPSQVPQVEYLEPEYILWEAHH